MRVVLDAGPLVAWLCPRDEHHEWARRAFSQVAPGSLICEAVLGEACHLVAKEGITRAKVVGFVRRARLQAVARSQELEVIEKLLDRYGNIPMDFADACVVRLAELEPKAAVCTTDGDFRFYRKCADEPISLLALFAS